MSELFQRDNPNARTLLPKLGSARLLANHDERVEASGLSSVLGRKDAACASINEDTTAWQSVFARSKRAGSGVTVRACWCRSMADERISSWRSRAFNIIRLPRPKPGADTQRFGVEERRQRGCYPLVRPATRAILSSMCNGIPSVLQGCISQNLYASWGLLVYLKRRSRAVNLDATVVVGGELFGLAEATIFASGAHGSSAPWPPGSKLSNDNNIINGGWWLVDGG